MRARPVVAGSQSQLLLEQRGLLAYYPFAAPVRSDRLEREFEFNGSAIPADRYWSSGADGLHVGVRGHRPGTWEGYFAVTRSAYPANSIFHVRMNSQSQAVPRSDQAGEAVFAIQTATTKQTGAINYVLVASATTAGVTRWEVGYAEGQITGAQTTILWQSPATATAAPGEEITVRTDGRSTLEVYLAGRLAFASTRLHLHIEPPLQPYLEVQGLGIGYEARFADLWVARDATLVATGLPPRTRVSFTPSKGPAAGAVTSAAGVLGLAFVPSAATGSGSLTLQGAAGTRRIGPFYYAGGDRYRVLKPGERPPRATSASWPGFAAGGVGLLAVASMGLVLWWRRRRLEIDVRHDASARGYQVTVTVINPGRREVQVEQIGLRAVGDVRIQQGNWVAELLPRDFARAIAPRGGAVREVFLLPEEWVDQRKPFRVLVRVAARPGPQFSAKQRIHNHVIRERMFAFLAS